VILSRKHAGQCGNGNNSCHRAPSMAPGERRQVRLTNRRAKTNFKSRNSIRYAIPGQRDFPECCVLYPVMSCDERVLANKKTARVQNLPSVTLPETPSRAEMPSFQFRTGTNKMSCGIEDEYELNSRNHARLKQPVALKRSGDNALKDRTCMYGCMLSSCWRSTCRSLYYGIIFLQ
jgi:hypothetical protein